MKIFGEIASGLKKFPFRMALPVLLAVGGLSMVTIGVWSVYAPAGWITGGLAALLLEHRVDMTTSTKREGRSG